MISVDLNNRFVVDLNNNLFSFLFFMGVLGGGNGRVPSDFKKCHGAQNAKIGKMGEIKKKRSRNYSFKNRSSIASRSSSVIETFFIGSFSTIIVLRLRIFSFNSRFRVLEVFFS